MNVYLSINIYKGKGNEGGRYIYKCWKDVKMNCNHEHSNSNHKEVKESQRKSHVDKSRRAIPKEIHLPGMEKYPLCRQKDDCLSPR